VATRTATRPAGAKTNQEPTPNYSNQALKGKQAFGSKQLRRGEGRETCRCPWAAYPYFVEIAEGGNGELDRFWVRDKVVGDEPSKG